VFAITGDTLYVIEIVRGKEQMDNPAGGAGFAWLELKIQTCRRPFQIADG
jgi:hypothetical protein